MPGICEKGIVDVVPDTVLITTTPAPLGAWLSTSPLASVMGALPAENNVPEMSTLVAVCWPLWPSPRTAVAVMWSPLGRVMMAPAEGVGAAGWGRLMVDGAAAPGVLMMRWVGSRREIVVSRLGPSVRAGEPGVRAVVPMLICDGLVGLMTMGMVPIEPIVVGEGCAATGMGVTRGVGF